MQQKFEPPADLEEAVARLETSVYQATGLLEDLEYARLVHGNGHHMRQEVAAFASKLLRERWQGATQTGQLSEPARSDEVPSH